MDGDSSAHTKVTYPLIAGPVSGIEPVFNSGRLRVHLLPTDFYVMRAATLAPSKGRLMS